MVGHFRKRLKGLLNIYDISAMITITWVRIRKIIYTTKIKLCRYT